MKKIILLLTALLLILSGCGQAGTNTEEKVAQAKEKLSGDFAARASITADYGDRVYEFVLDCSGDTLTVVEPENIAGVTAHLTGDGKTVLEFEDIAVDTGELEPTGLTPVSAVPAMLSAIRSGYVAETGSEMRGDTEYITAVFKVLGTVDEQEVTHRVWFEAESLRLAYGEIEADGNTVIFAEFE